MKSSGKKRQIIQSNQKVQKLAFEIKSNETKVFTAPDTKIVKLIMVIISFTKLPFIKFVGLRKGLTLI